MLAITLFFGLRPKGYDFSNNATLVSNPNDIRFGMHGIAYTNFLRLRRKVLINSFAIEIAFKPRLSKLGRFGFLLMFHNGDDNRQFIVAQWHSWIIVMNGNDYDHSRKTPRISVNLNPGSQDIRFLTINSDQEGTSIYLDGKHVKTMNDLRLIIPQDPKTRLILGNGADGRHPWQGTIYGLAFFDHALGNNQIQAHFRSWQRNRNFLFAEKERPVILYLFDEKLFGKIADHGSACAHLEIPSSMHVIKKRFLMGDWHRTAKNDGFLQDALLNLLGFVPLGFVFTFTFSKAGSGLGKHAVLLTFALGISVSLLIEILQVWIPTRSSDVFDLFFNTIGLLIGIYLFRHTKWISRPETD